LLPYPYRKDGKVGELEKSDEGKVGKVFVACCILPCVDTNKQLKFHEIDVKEVTKNICYDL